MNSSFLAPLLISLVPMLGWGALGVFVAKLSRKVGSLNAGFLIQGAGFVFTLILWPFFFSVPRDINWLILIIISAVGAGAYAVYCHALKVGRVSVVVPVTSSWAVITAALGIVFLKESVSVLKVLSIVTVICGIIGLTVDWKELKKTRISRLSAGIIPACITAVGWGGSFFFLGPLTREMGWFFTTLGNRALVALFLFFLFFRQTGNEKAEIRKVPRKILAVVAALDVIATTGYNLAVSRYEVSYVSVISSASPLVSVILASILLKDRTDFVQKAGIFLITAGIVGLQF